MQVHEHTPTRFHIQRDGRTFGPYTVEQVRQHVVMGQLRPHDLVWPEATPDWVPLSSVRGFEDLAASAVVATGPPQRTTPSAYHPVAALKFLVLSACTMGVYELYWFYKNWVFIRLRDESRILPFARALFSPIWCYAFARDLARAQDRPVGVFTTAAVVSYIVLSVLWRLPDPWWLLSLVSFIPLLPLVLQVNAINRQHGSPSSASSRFGAAHAAVCIVGLPLTLFVVLPALNILPSSQVVHGSRLPAHVTGFLRAEAGLSESDSVIYFYSPATFSFRAEGSVVTGEQVISYYTDETDADTLVVFSARYEDILDVEVTYGSWLEPTVIDILIGDYEGFVLVAATEGRRDRLFVNEILSRWRAARAGAHSARHDVPGLSSHDRALRGGRFPASRNSVSAHTPSSSESGGTGSRR